MGFSSSGGKQKSHGGLVSPASVASRCGDGGQAEACSLSPSEGRHLDANPRRSQEPCGLLPARGNGIPGTEARETLSQVPQPLQVNSCGSLMPPTFSLAARKTFRRDPAVVDSPAARQSALFREKRSTAKTPRLARFQTSALQTEELDASHGGVGFDHRALPLRPSPMMSLTPW